ncbi:MAG: AAA family ATPase [Paracoccaceae bacterium]
MLIIFSGLSGTGKTTLAKALARRVGAVYLRIDSIEWGLAQSALAVERAEDAGYRAAQAVAEDNLRLGHPVVADSVNPWELTRRAWRAVAERVGAPAVDVEVVCSDRKVHRRRVEGRRPDRPGAQVPDWATVEARDYQPWQRRRIIVDTAGQPVAACVDRVVTALGGAEPVSEGEASP